VVIKGSACQKHKTLSKPIFVEVYALGLPGYQFDLRINAAIQTINYSEFQGDPG